MTKLIECVPNFSEGQDTVVIDSFVGALEGIPGLIVLDRSSDASHHRTVLTFVGTPEALKQGVLNLFELAARHIDLREHVGEHPRMGAIDVVPFIPVRNATMEDCVALARDVAAEVARRFEVPVFLYGEAATAPHRKLLSSIRKGEFEGLAEKMQAPEWKPDFGPDGPHPAMGASVFGARPFLIAYNLQLDTADVRIAQAIARAVRTSTGGLPHVQAMGVYLADREQAQVSMNLLDFQKTPIHRVQELVKIEAARFGARILGAEIVGLVPQGALLEAASYYLQIENWQPDLVLENALVRKGE